MTNYKYLSIGIVIILCIIAATTLLFFIPDELPINFKVAVTAGDDYFKNDGEINREVFSELDWEINFAPDQRIRYRIDMRGLDIANQKAVRYTHSEECRLYYDAENILIDSKPSFLKDGKIEGRIGWNKFIFSLNKDNITLEVKNKDILVNTVVMDKFDESYKIEVLKYIGAGNNIIAIIGNYKDYYLFNYNIATKEISIAKTEITYGLNKHFYVKDNRIFCFNVPMNRKTIIFNIIVIDGNSVVEEVKVEVEGSENMRDSLVLIEAEEILAAKERML